MNTLPQVEIARSGPDYFTARDIARALDTNKKKIQRAAVREQWPARQNGNKLEYCPPQHVARLIIAAPSSASSPSVPDVRFADLAHSDTARELVLLREQAVQALRNTAHLGKEAALRLVVSHFKTERPLFRISVSQLRVWDARYTASGLDGLVEQKRGRVGRKAFAADLSEEEILKGRAAAVEFGSVSKQGRSQLNFARAYRQLVGDPTIAGPARRWLHGGNASKSYVPPSVREKLRVAPLAAKLIQQGPKAMKLDGPFTECSYDNTPAGSAFTADDMTANVYVWVEWPNEQGFLLIRPQILAAMDIGSMAWLNVRAIIRPKGQYTKDDVWGLIGDVLDNGLHVAPGGAETPSSPKIDMIAVLEGGIWQSNVVRGHKTGFSDEERVGGLRSLGVKVIHTRTPRGKIIETAFNQLQHAMDNIRGFCGRMEMKDCPEDTKANLALVRNGHSHPRQFFMHLDEFTAHLAGVMKALNNERNDGKILRGKCPAEKWAIDQPQFVQFSDAAKYLYRSAYRIEQVTRNGVRITVGSGKFQVAYTYSNPEVLEPQRGRRVLVYWNDGDPDTDAVIYSVKNSRPDKFLCVAKRVLDVPRFGANRDQMAAEATRKKLSSQLAVSQSRSLAPYLQRRALPAPGSAGPVDHTSTIATVLQKARTAAAEKEKAKAKIARTIRRVEVPAEMESLPARSAALPEMSAERITEILGETPI